MTEASRLNTAYTALMADIEFAMHQSTEHILAKRANDLVYRLRAYKAQTKKPINVDTIEHMIQKINYHFKPGAIEEEDD